jgi:hypothetical protein
MNVMPNGRRNNVPSRSQKRAEANFDRIHRERRQAECLAQTSAEEAVRVRIGHAMAAQPPEPEPTFQPSTVNDRSQNVLRPQTLGVIATPQGMVPFPQITVLGATTDPGRLPDAFLDRFLDLTLDEYTEPELACIAEFASRRLGLTLMGDVPQRFAAASRGTPRIVGNYVKSAQSIAGADLYVPPLLADQVLYKMHRVTDEGLTSQMQAALVFLYRHCKRTRGDGEVLYQASVNSIATAIGLSRDTKAVQLRVEPFLIRSGYLQVGSGGRVLTETGLQRAKELSDD